MPNWFCLLRDSSGLVSILKFNPCKVIMLGFHRNLLELGKLSLPGIWQDVTADVKYEATSLRSWWGRQTLEKLHSSNIPQANSWTLAERRLSAEHRRLWLVYDPCIRVLVSATLQPPECRRALELFTHVHTLSRQQSFCAKSWIVAIFAFAGHTVSCNYSSQPL